MVEAQKAKKSIEWKIRISTKLDTETRLMLLAFLKERSHCFAWDIFDMIGIDPKIITHKLHVDMEFKPVKQNRRKFAPERNQIVNEDVKILKSNGLIREVQYLDWLANVMVVKNKEREANSVHRLHGS